MKQCRKILVVENSVAVTGALKSILRSSNEMKDDFEFTFILPRRSSAIKLVSESGFSMHTLPLIELSKKPAVIISYLPFLMWNTLRFAMIVARMKPDLIVSNDFYNMVMPLYRFLGGGVPYITYVRFIPSRFPRILRNIWFACHKRFAASVIVVSKVVQQSLPFTNNVVCIPNEPPADSYAYCPAPSGIILYPSNYIPGKGHQYALDAFRDLAKEFPSWKLRFVGGDMGLEKNRKFKSELQLQAEQWGLTEQVQWEGFSERIREEYIGASFVLNFSDAESFSMTCLESLYYGRAVIATDSGGPAEILGNENAGILVPVAEVTAMRAAIRLLIVNPDLRKEIEQNGYNRARNAFSLNTIINSIRKVYFSACKADSYQ